MENNTMIEKKNPKAERVQEEIMAAGGVGAKNPLVISLKAERVQEPEAAAAVPAEARVNESGWVELAVNPYQRVTIDLPALQVNITLEQPVAGADWNAGLEPEG